MPLTLDRTKSIERPALCTYNGATFFSNAPIKIEPLFPANPLKNTVIGTFDQSRITDMMFRVTVPMVGEWEDMDVSISNVLDKRPGQSIIGATDLPLVIHAIDNYKLTFLNAALIGLPVINASVKKSVLGQMVFMAILKKGGTPGTVAHYYAEATASYPGDGEFDGAAVLTVAASAAWGATAPWDDFTAREGFVVTPNVQVEPLTVDGATIDYKLRDASVTCQAIPFGPTPTEVLAKFPSTGFGVSRAAGADDLIISADGLWVKLNKATLMDGAQHFGQREVLDTLTWQANRSWTAGVPDPLLVLDTEEPA